MLSCLLLGRLGIVLRLGLGCGQSVRSHIPGCSAMPLGLQPPLYLRIDCPGLLAALITAASSSQSANNIVRHCHVCRVMSFNIASSAVPCDEPRVVYLIKGAKNTGVCNHDLRHKVAPVMYS